MKFTNEDVQQILQLLDATKYEELHLETESYKLTLRRSRESGDWSQESQVLSAPNIIQASPSVPVSVTNGGQSAALNPPGVRTSGWVDVHAHLPGTFYRAPKPGAPSLVEIGSRVEEKTVVGIIETMKLMNAVHAHTRGELVEICIANAQFVEKDTVLMRIKPEVE